MEIKVERNIDPDAVSANVSFNESDIAAAFDRSDPNEELFYRLFGPTFEQQPISVQLQILSEVAALAEMAVELNLSAGTAVPKEGASDAS